MNTLGSFFSPQHAASGCDKSARFSRVPALLLGELRRTLARVRRVFLALGVTTLVMFLAPSAFAATCHCDVTCTSSNGQTINKSWNEQDISQFPPGPQAGKCKDYCQATLNAQTAIWAREGQLCKTGNCSGTAKLGTLSPYNITPVGFDNAAQNFCAPPPPGGVNPCCPEFTKNIKPSTVASFFTEGQHALGQPYTMTFNSNSAFSNQLETNLAAWAKWLQVDGCPGVVGFKVSYQLYNTGSPVKPTGPNPSGLVPFGAPHVVIYAGTSVLPPSFTWSVPASPNWWFVKATVTTIGANGQEVACKKDDGCFNNFYTGWIDDAITTMKTGPGSAAGTNGSRVRFID